jgi:hypothetical protein
MSGVWGVLVVCVRVCKLKLQLVAGGFFFLM